MKPAGRVIPLTSPTTGESWAVPVAFEDAQVLALNKPAGLLTSPDRYDPRRPDLMRLLHEGVAAGRPWAAERGLSYLATAHRLDADTTGLLLLAKDRASLVTLANHFGSETPKQTYVALVQGVPESDEFIVENGIAPHWFKPGLMHISVEGKRAVTHFRVAERFAGGALVECRPLTARTHQLRLHLQDAGHPVMGDTVYGGEPLLLSRLKRGYRVRSGEQERPLIGTAALHAWKLELPHPVTGEPLTLEAPWPKSLELALKNLRRFAARKPATSSSPAGWSG